jgi:hypothetical protein
VHAQVSQEDVVFYGGWQCDCGYLMRIGLFKAAATCHLFD